MKDETLPVIIVIIPAYNEESAIPLVIKEIPSFVTEIIVVNNNSSDDTGGEALRAGATVIEEHRPGYGYACLKGIDYAKKLNPQPDIIVFLDGDHSDFPSEMQLLIDKIVNDDCDLVIGSRALGAIEKGSMTFPQLFGNWLATRLLQLFYSVKYTDLGPFRAVKFASLLRLDMQDTTYGWTVEMQLKAAKLKMKIAEVPVRYRKRIGFSKISGTIRGTVLAGYKIIATIFKYL